MNHSDYIQIFLYLFTLAVTIPFLGNFMKRVFMSEKTLLDPLIKPIENWVYKIAGIDSNREMDFKEYSRSLLILNLLGFLAVFLFQIFQYSLPLNPQGLPNISFDLAFNTAVSFMTNTNWQAYSGESTLSYFVQMTGLTVQNFLSAATGMGVVLALIRGFSRKSCKTIGNFWIDTTKTTLYLLLPLSFILSILLVGQGVVQTFSPYSNAISLEGNEFQIPLGPAASQVAIKQLGTNGGGFFGVNSAHPFENPTPFSNYLQMISILLLPAAQVYMFGLMINARKQGLSILATMFIFFVVILAIALKFEYSTNPNINGLLAMEGKETRFGVTNSIIWATATTQASNGSVNSMHDSLSPVAGLTTIFNIMLGEVIFGGIGAGLYGMFMFVILTVFIAGLMVGRTPEYLGKKIEGAEIIWTIVAVLTPCAVILLGSALAFCLPPALASISNPGPHGLSEILYAFSSAAGNNGSAFGGLTVNTKFFNYSLGIAMLIGRFSVIIPSLIIAGKLAAKKSTPFSTGSFPTDGWLFIILLSGVILIVGALTFFPVLILGPIVEHFLMLSGRVF